MSLKVTAPITPIKPSRKRASDAAIVTPHDPKKLKAAATPVDEKKWTRAMSIFRKFMPGLGHDGVGLYGTLTNSTMRKMIEAVECEDKTHVDVGAADGKVLLGAMALGARHAYGLEISGPALADKFHAMRDKLANHFPASGEAVLKTGTDICDLAGASVEAWLDECFGAGDAESAITVSAVWHGFNIEAKECLLAAISSSARVSRFSLIGPCKRDYGNPERVIDFCAQSGAKVELVSDELAHLSGSGENQRVMTFEVLRSPRPAPPAKKRSRRR